MAKGFFGRQNVRSNLLTVAVVFAVLLALLLTVYVGNYRFPKVYAGGENGKFDLADVDFDGSERASLNGNWDYYKEVFKVTDSNGVEPSITASVAVPAVHTGVFDVATNFSDVSFATYECTIENINANDDLTVYIPNISCAYRIFINGTLVTSSGNVTKDVDTMWSTPVQDIRLPFVLEPATSYRLAVELSTEKNSGLYMPVILANYSDVTLSQSFDIAGLFIIGGIILSSAFIFIFLKRFVNKDLYSLWLPALSLVLLVRMLLTSDGYSIIQRFMFNVSFENTGIFTFVSTFIIKLISLIYITKCLKIKTSDNVFVAFSALFLTLAVAVRFLPASVYDVYYYMMLQMLSVIIDIYIINKLSVEICKKTEHALLYLLSYIFMAFGLLIDVFYSNGVIHRNCSWVMPVCFLLFVAFTSVIHIRRIKKVFNYALEAQQLETELERANNSIMLSQIQPHFMYNALNTIKSLIKRDPPKAEQAVIDFSMYLRGNMDSLTKIDPIPFSEELDHIKHYCNIEQLRFQDKLDVFYEIGPDDFYVPTLSVQPIVENAIKHGVTKRPEGGSVTISTDEDELNYYITVEDDGIGFDVNSIDKQDDPKRSHVGIKNIKDRFEVIMNAKVTIESEIGKGSKITVKLPKQTNFKTLQESLEFRESKNNSLKEMEI